MRLFNKVSFTDSVEASKKLNLPQNSTIVKAKLSFNFDDREMLEDKIILLIKFFTSSSSRIFSFELLLLPLNGEKTSKFFFTRFLSVDLLLVFFSFFRYKNILIKFQLSGKDSKFHSLIFPLAADNFVVCCWCS